MRTLCLLALSIAASCSRQHGPRGSAGDPATEPDGVEPGTGEGTSETDALKELVHDVFSELQRDAELRCLCYVADGDYPSTGACLAEVGRGYEGTACLEQALARTDGDLWREQFECMLEARLRTNNCLERADCGDQLTRCYELGPECPSPDPVLLTAASRECPGAIGLPR